MRTPSSWRIDACSTTSSSDCAARPSTTTDACCVARHRQERSPRRETRRGGGGDGERSDHGAVAFGRALQLPHEVVDLVGLGDDDHAVARVGAGAAVTGHRRAQHVPRHQHDRAPEHDEPREQRVADDELHERDRQRRGERRADGAPPRRPAGARLLGQPEPVRGERAAGARSPSDHANRDDPDQEYSWLTACALLSPTTVASVPTNTAKRATAAHAVASTPRPPAAEPESGHARR